MPITLPPPLMRAAGLSAWLRRAALGAALLVAGTPAATAQTVFGLSGTDLTSLELTSPTTRTRKPIAGLTSGLLLVGLDFRPATGQLYALGYNAATQQGQLYILDITAAGATVPATAVGAPSSLLLGGPTERIGFDFNPTVDRIRVVSTNNGNYRLNPNDGVATTDGMLAFTTTAMPADPNAGQDPFVGIAAYTNSFIGATGTTLYNVDEQRSILTIQNPPNVGTLNTVATLNTPFPLNTPGNTSDLDIFTNPITRAEKAYLSLNVPDPDPSRIGQFITALYAVNLATGAVALEGGVGGGSPFDPPTNANPAPGITDIAVQIRRTAPAVSGQLLYAVSATSNLLSFYSGDPSNIISAVSITNIADGQTLVGTDFRPNTGELFGLGYNPTTGESRLYTINLTTAGATPVGAAPITLSLGTTAAAVNSVGFDFNPTVDRIRVTGSNRTNYRLNPNNGALAFIDGTLTYAPGDESAGLTPQVGSVAYTNSFAGSTATILYDIDEARNRIVRQDPPNAGTLNTVGQLLGLTIDPANAIVDFDMYFDVAGQVNRPFIAVNNGGSTSSSLYTLVPNALTTNGDKTATLAGSIGLGILVRDISALPDPATVPNSTAAVGGRLLYGIAGGNLVSFDSNNPGVLRSAVNITGLPTDGTQVLVGADFRPATGQLFALGYNAAAQQGQLYTLNISSGALSPVGSLQAMLLGTTAQRIGFDFNPVPDRIRIVSGETRVNLRMNPTDGTFLTDTPVTNPAGAPTLSGVAYTNNDTNAATGTTLYGYDQARNVLLRSMDANAGTYVDQAGASGLTANLATGVDFDIFADLTAPATPVSTAFLVASPGGATTDNLYTINLTTGIASAGARIGVGSNLTGLAAFLTPVVVADLTWTGFVDTQWALAGNWEPMRIPTAADDVNIPDTANDPVVRGSQVARNATLGSGALLTIAANSVLSLDGNFTNNGGTTAAGDRGEVRFTGSAARSISGTVSFFNTLTGGSGGLALNAPVRVQRVLVVSGTVTSNGNLTLLSNTTGTGQVLQTGANSVTGNVTVQRFITPSNSGLGYRHYSAPVTGSTVADLATPGFTPVVNSDYNTAADPSLVSPFPTVFSYEQSRVTSSGDYAKDFDKGFQSPAALSSPLEVGRGYTVNIAGTQTVDFVGTVNSGNINQSGLSRSAAPASQDATGWQLLGNPYPSPIDWDVVGRSNVDGAVYVFRSTDVYDGTYSSYVAGNGGVGVNGGSDQIAMGQGFFVRVTTPGTSNGQVSFTNAARITDGSNPIFQRTAATDPMVRLELRGTSGPADETLVYFDASATVGFDSALDAYKLTAGTAPVLATEAAGAVRLSINALPALTTADVTVPLRLQVYQNGTFTLRAAGLTNVPTGTYVYLRDAQTGATIDLAQQASYSFAAVAGTQAPRFSLLLTQSKVLATAPVALAQQVSLYPNPARQAVAISLPADLRQQAVAVTLVNTLGQVVLRQTLAAGRTAVDQQLPLTGVSKGVYTLRLTTAQGVVNKRLVVE
ncbi:DUF4394 domain-containing protein [Hymenobacter elongatus]|uniref:DUF4394 domain-containing protein n=1 Tax=Hymenobacter elongatus TaxID=877208 RepID=A0A4Z0PQ04_9BACT|nr:DUF4394 domain-containing protein [Hymenobacter elongatus]TGE18955.1 DUF4394 domain-containing protein [Hymenobacter elongatus]